MLVSLVEVMCFVTHPSLPPYTDPMGLHTTLFWAGRVVYKLHVVEEHQIRQLCGAAPKRHQEHWH